MGQLAFRIPALGFTYTKASRCIGALCLFTKVRLGYPALVLADDLFKEALTSIPVRGALTRLALKAL